jgi:catechol 2,3-dioxygenase-like lactoylglutathione lyase family enzyme
MFKIGKLFHLTHLVDDLDACDQWYDEVFSCNRFYRGYEKAAVRDASLLTIGEVVMEPLSLAKVPDAEKSPIGKFKARFGQRFHSIAWYVEDVADLAAQFDRHQVKMFNLVGRPVKMPVKPGTAIWTQPRQTHGLLEFAEIPRFTNDARLQPGWSPAFWRERHPLGIERASHITVLVRDLAPAVFFYRDVLRGRLIHEEQRTGEAKSAFVSVGEDTIVELRQPLSTTSAEGRDLEQNGDSIYAVTFKTINLARAAEFLSSKGQRIESQTGDSLILAQENTFGMVVGFTERAIPNDPRS